MSFTIGDIFTGRDKNNDNGYTDHTTVGLVDEGIQLFHCDASMLGGGLGTYTPAQARELGTLLINAADRWAELNAQVQQSKAETAALERSLKARIKDALA